MELQPFSIDGRRSFQTSEMTVSSIEAGKPDHLRSRAEAPGKKPDGDRAVQGISPPLSVIGVCAFV